MKHARDDYDRIQDPAGLIPEEEPVFLIRGQDLAAPATLIAYAGHAEALGASKELVRKVLDHAHLMHAYQETIGKGKVPDL